MRLRLGSLPPPPAPGPRLSVPGSSTAVRCLAGVVVEVLKLQNWEYLPTNYALYSHGTTSTQGSMWSTW